MFQKTQKQMAETLNVDQAKIFRLLKVIEKIQTCEKWVLLAHELNERQ